MVINLHKFRIAVAIAGIVLALIPILYKYDIFKEAKQPVEEEKPVYGLFLPWNEVTQIFPKFAKATVIDFDTGRRFQVQRRGGTYHTDVQPLTANDTAIMKEIYNGQWGWKRRAIMVQLDDGKKIAASMNGMPHGQGAIPNNRFNGHFCIHFRGSKTHGSRKVDVAHQMMIWKSAGLLDQQLQTLQDQQVIEVFFTAIDQGDLNIAQKLVDKNSEVLFSDQDLKNIKYIRTSNIKRINNNNFSVDIQMGFKDSKMESRKNIIIKTTHQNNCRLEAESIMSLFKKSTWGELSPISSTVTSEEDLEALDNL